MKKYYYLVLVLCFLCLPSTIYAQTTIDEEQKEINIEKIDEQHSNKNVQEIEQNESESLPDSEVYQEEDIDEVDSDNHNHSQQENTSEEIEKSQEELQKQKDESEHGKRGHDAIKRNQDKVNTDDQEVHKKDDRKKSKSSVEITSQKSVDEWYSEAMNEPSASGRVNLFVDALTIYKNNAKLLEGLNSSVESLLDWATKQHNQGNFATAIDRYNRIIALAEMVDQSLVDKATQNKSYAEKGQKILTPEQYYDQAMKISTASGRFNTFVEAYNLYPENSRIIEGLHSSAESLLIWARRQHQNGNFTTAIDRYQKILEAPTLPILLQESVNSLLDLANNNEIVPSLNSVLDKINRQTTVSNIFRSSKEAAVLYPENKQLNDRLNDAATSLLDWASKQHTQGNFSTAIQRYQMILDTPFLHKSIRTEAEKLHKDAEIGKRSADAIYQAALAENRVSYKFNLFIEGYNFYPNDKRFSRGIEESARALFNWAVNKHHAADYETAISRYENLLDAPVLSDKFKNDVKDKLIEAREERRPADIIYELILGSTTASARFDLYVEGVNHYPNDSRFINGLDKSAKQLLDLAIRYHNNSNYSGALTRYEKLITTQKVPSLYKEIANFLDDFADNQKRIPLIKEFVALAEENGTVSGIFDTYIVGYYVHPRAKSMIEGMVSSSIRYYDYAYRRHELGEYKNAIKRYQKLIATKGVPTWLVNVTEQNLTRAKNNEEPTNQFIQYTEYHISIEEAINIQMNASPPPQTDKYREQPAYISSQHVTLIQAGIITGNGVNLRTSPSFGNNVYRTVGNSTTFELIREVNGTLHAGSRKWYEIKYNNRTLYVHSSLAKPNGFVARVTQSTQVRANNNPNSHVYGNASRGTEFRVIKTGNNWHQISYSNNWRNATREDVRQNLDPNNFMFDEKQLFQFLDLSKPSGATTGLLNKYLSGKGTLKNTGQAFIKAGELHGINEIYLLSHALLETGHGTSDLAKGIEVGKTQNGELKLVTSTNRGQLRDIKKVYNMFGIGAVDSCPRECGAKRAYEEGWTTPEKAIIGGAAFIGNNYIDAGQNTLYKMRWNPDAMAKNGRASHQYATDIGWASKQLDSIYSIYQELGLYILHLDIPIYQK